MINSLLNPLWDDFIGRRPCLLHRFDKTNEANQATKMEGTTPALSVLLLPHKANVQAGEPAAAGHSGNRVGCP